MQNKNFKRILLANLGLFSSLASGVINAGELKNADNNSGFKPYVNNSVKKQEVQPSSNSSAVPQKSFLNDFLKFFGGVITGAALLKGSEYAWAKYKGDQPHEPTELTSIEGHPLFIAAAGSYGYYTEFVPKNGHVATEDDNYKITTYGLNFNKPEVMDLYKILKQCFDELFKNKKFDSFENKSAEKIELTLALVNSLHSLVAQPGTDLDIGGDGVLIKVNDYLIKANDKIQDGKNDGKYFLAWDMPDGKHEYNLTVTDGKDCNVKCKVTFNKANGKLTFEGATFE